MKEILDKIYDLSLEEHPDLKKYSKLEIYHIIEKSFLEIQNFENAGNPLSIIDELGVEVVSNIAALWVFSGPDTYDSSYVSDRYRHFLWSKGMDRARVSCAESLYNRIKTLTGFGPHVFYNGSNEQNSILENVLASGKLNIPPYKFNIIGKNIQNTVDQVKTLILPNDILKKGNYIGLISHAPHLVRISYILNKYKHVLSDLSVMFFPIPTQKSGSLEYAISEIKGLLYYIYIRGNALKKPYLYNFQSGSKNNT